MELYVLRHGIAEQAPGDGSGDDARRALTGEGASKMKRIARGMRAMGLTFDVVLTSPYRRARETASIVAAELGLADRVELLSLLEPGEDMVALVKNLAAREGNVDHCLLVGHEPMLGSLVSLLVAGDTNLNLTMKKGGLCKLTVDDIRLGRCATLEWLLTPKQLASLR